MTTKKQGPSKALEATWEHLSLDLFRVNTELTKLERQKAGILSAIKGILASIDTIPDNWVTPPELQLGFDEKTTLGNAMESLLKDRGSLSQREIIDALTELRFPLNTKSPHVVIANAVKQDTRKRFKRLKDGRVALVGTKE